MLEVKIFFLIGLVAFLTGEAFSLSCKDLKGKDVDWFVILKLPRQKNQNEFITEGGGYGYIDENAKEPGWFLADKDIGDENSAIGKTFSQVYKNPHLYSYIQYNDDKPHGEEDLGSNTKIYAHAKGALVWDNKNAVWLVYSVPRFLPVFDGKKYFYPENGRKHAQNILCITFDSKETVNKILDHLALIKAQVYASNVGKKVSKAFSQELEKNFDILVNKKNSDKEPKYDIEKLDEDRLNELTFQVSTKKNVPLTIIGKTRRDKVDVWSAVAQRKLNSSMVFKYWVLMQKTDNLLKSTCSLKKSLNAIDMEVNFVNAKDNTIKWAKNDHSKWGICDGENKCTCKTENCSCDGEPSLCYCGGDMNRALSQTNRGGGAVCLFVEKVHSTFEKSYKTRMGCNNELEDNPFLEEEDDSE